MFLFPQGIKFGILDFDLTVEAYWEESWNKKALLNIGDAAEYFVVEQLLYSIGIQESQIIRLSIKDLIRYKGEKLLVPLNIAFDSYVGYNEIFENISKDIIPIFLGISLTKPSLNSIQLNCLRNYSPIGCRDERTYIYLKNQGISCYLNGCTASILDVNSLVRKNKNKNKILFIDVPRKVKDYIPNNIKKDIVFLNQELYCRKEEMYGISPKEWAKDILSSYGKPKMIVTSRFHGAVLGLANNIPVILILEKYTFRFSWLQNYIKIYTEERFCDINWDPIKINYTVVRNLIKNIAVERIKSTMRNYEMFKKITDLQHTKATSEQESSNQVLYYLDVIESIKKTWDKNKKIEYGLWGINDNSKHIHNFISSYYPNAKLVEVYDMFQRISFNGLESKNPSAIRERNKQKNFYVIVTAYLASRVADDIFRLTCFDRTNAFLCKREFIEKRHL